MCSVPDADRMLSVIAPRVGDRWVETFNSAGGRTEWQVAQVHVDPEWLADGVKLVDADPTRAKAGHTLVLDGAAFRQAVSRGRLVPAHMVEDGDLGARGLPASVKPTGQPAPTADRNRYGRLVFCVGVDPGAKGACAVLAVRDTPADDAAHGKVVAASVFDLPTVARDDGGRDLDVVGFGALLYDALHIDPVGGLPRDAVSSVVAVVERPSVGGGARFGASSLVTQAVNVGAVWAVMSNVCANWNGLSDAPEPRTEWASSRARGGWRDEVGCEKGEEADAVMRVRDAVAERPDDFVRAVAADGQVLRDARPDRLVAVLLGEVARRRWLGLPPVVTAKAKRGAPQAAKARAKDRRKEALARAVAPLTVAKARHDAMFGRRCDWHQMDAGFRCQPRMKCCEARLLDWAWRQRPDMPGMPVRSTAAHTAVSLIGDVLAIERRPATAKHWAVDTVERAGHCQIGDATFDVLHDHGLVVLEAGSKRVRYVVTERGRWWSRRARAAEMGSAEGTVAHA